MDFTLKILRKITLPNTAFTMRAIRLHFLRTRISRKIKHCSTLATLHMLQRVHCVGGRSWTASRHFLGQCSHTVVNWFSEKNSKISATRCNSMSLGAPLQCGSCKLGSPANSAPQPPSCVWGLLLRRERGEEGEKGRGEAKGRQRKGG